MRRRIGREDLSGVNPFSNEEQKLEGVWGWRVYEEFGLVEQDGQQRFFKATTYESELYAPLVDTPYLFLEFARLPEQKGHLYEALDGWLTKYGLLGLSRQDSRSLDLVRDVRLTPVGDWVPEISTPPLRYDD